MKREFTVPISCNRLARADVARELCLDIVGWPGHRSCYNIGRIVINDTVAMAEPVPAAPPPDVIAPKGKPKFYAIFFDWDKSDITPLAQRVIGSILEDWESDPEALNLIGHADRSGSDSYNQTLSQQRVDSVTSAVSAGRIEESRISGAAKGESQLLVPTRDGVRERQNRRVVITVD